MTDKNNGYEHNLKLYNESIRKDLDITLTSMIPTQKNLMKTILWLNTSVIGLSIAALTKNINIWYIIVPCSFSFLAILIILFSLKDGRVKTLGSPSIETIERINKDKNEKINGLIDMNKSFKIALDANALLITKRATKIYRATNLTIASICSVFFIIIIYSYINFLKGGNTMGDKEIKRPISSSSSAKPEKNIVTNNTNASVRKRNGKVIADKKIQSRSKKNK